MLLQSPGSQKRAALLLLLLCAVASNGCSRFTRTRQCRALIAQVNPALDDVVTITGTGGAAGGAQPWQLLARRRHEWRTSGSEAKDGTTSSQYMAAAGRYERLAKQLGPLEFSTEDMAKTVAEYASVMTASALSLRTLAAAMDANNYAEAERASRELDRLSAREHAAVGRIDAWCQPGS